MLIFLQIGYEPIVPHDEGWADAIRWFRDNWLPKFNKNNGIIGAWRRKYTYSVTDPRHVRIIKHPATRTYLAGIATQSQRKIDIQAGKRKS